MLSSITLGTGWKGLVTGLLGRQKATGAGDHSGVNIGPDGILKELSVKDFGVFMVMFVGLYVFTKCMYNLYFHPLAGFPGPRLAAVSNVYKTYMILSGRFPQISSRNHTLYGPIYRAAPNSLSFSTPSAQKAIYGHPPPKSPHGPYSWNKSEQYSAGDEVDSGSNLMIVRDEVRHAEMVRMTNGAFGVRALKDQEDLVTKHTHRWIEQIERYGSGSKSETGEDLQDQRYQNEKGINAVKWFNWVTFDIIGDLAFGEAFGCVESVKSHFWVGLIFDALIVTMYMIGLRDYPWLQSIGKIVMMVLQRIPAISEPLTKHFEYSKNAIIKRMNHEPSRKDFMSYVLENKQGKELPIEELVSHSALLVLAGSETTATMLVGTTYYLLKNPSTLAKLTSEIRNKFTSLSEITNQSTTNLEYLNAVINEGLRIFPPVSGHLERTSPGAVVDEKWIPKGTHVHVCARTMTRSPKYWKNGDTFIPERWIGKNDEDVLEASKPFSIGPRGCIGKNLAYMEMRMILAKLVWRFDLELVNEREEAGKWGWLEDARVIGMWVKPDLWLKFTKREQEEKS